MSKLTRSFHMCSSLWDFLGFWATYIVMFPIFGLLADPDGSIYPHKITKVLK